MSSLTESGAWRALSEHRRTLEGVRMRDLFERDPGRYADFSLDACGLRLDYSRHRLDAAGRDRLLDLARDADLPAWIARMFAGERINVTERRAALHVALRNRSGRPVMVDGADVMPAVRKVLDQMRAFSDAVRDGAWTGFTGRPVETVVNIGIGGSDLGPRMVARALAPLRHPRLGVRFVSNLDPDDIHETLRDLDPATTLFVIVSKTFTTQETLANATAARRWLVDGLGDEAAVSRHFVAVSTALERVAAFGIAPENTFAFWDWVGGRFSVWSAVGLTLPLLLGMDRFEEFLAGAHEMDEHFRSAPLEANMPVLLGLIGIWYINFHGAESHAILPYSHRLEFLPAYLQQLEMESNGKCVTRDGEPVDYATAPIIWGAPANNGQHAFFQLLHQGTHLVPADFIVTAQSDSDAAQHRMLLANCLAQTAALMHGKPFDVARAELRAAGAEGDAPDVLARHRSYPGDRPSSLIGMAALTPRTLGALIALYEHKVFVQSVCWRINPFDQWGVELGKQMAGVLLPVVGGDAPPDDADGATRGMLDYLRANGV